LDPSVYQLTVYSGLHAESNLAHLNEHCKYFCTSRKADAHFNGRTMVLMEMRDLALKFQQLRKDARLTQEELAAASGVARGSIQAIEDGHANPKIKTLLALEKAMGSTLIEIATANTITEIGLARHGQLLKDVPVDFQNWNGLSEGIQAACLYFVTGDERFRELLREFLPREFLITLKHVREALASDESTDQS
jgi:DNA-binding XRE family transcriptional regulator